ncbi:hypothetical protein W823_09570 [Williamsia sp. D3]|nr:hypothetical protein W823_09570 [Williamsia sp. D3]
MCQRVGWIRLSNGLPVDRDRAPAERLPGNRAGNVFASRPRQARDSQHLTRKDIETHPAEPVSTYVTDSESWNPVRVGLRRGGLVLSAWCQYAAQHQLDKTIVRQIVDRGRRDASTVPQDRHGVGQPEYLVEMVTDE